MNTILDQIVARTRAAVAEAAARLPEAALHGPAEAARAGRRPFAAALRETAAPRIIAEIKRASPSKGAIRPDLDPAALARAYEAGGAAALSVLTEPSFFQGSLDDLRTARAAVRLPVLRKDFLLTPYQVYEAAAAGADAVLLIVRLLDDPVLERLHRLAAELGLDALVEVHDRTDARRARRIGARLVGINNRDLSSFQVEAGRAVSLAEEFEADTLVIAASGIAGRGDVVRHEAAGVHSFLVGESLVRAADPAAALRALRGGKEPV